MSEPRRNDAGSQSPPRQPSRPTPGVRPATPGRDLGPRVSQPARPGSATGTSPRWGSLPWGRGIVLVASSAVLGALITIVLRRDPGFLLGLLVVLGTLAACLAVNPRRAYLIIPAPALAYLAAAIPAGLVRDWAADSSRTLLAINAARWVASGFLWMAAATALAVVITGLRWLRSRPSAGYRPPPTRGGQLTPPPGRSARDRSTSAPDRGAGRQ
jgi:hypothetical protein